MKTPSREVGSVLVEKYGGFFHNFIRAGPNRLYHEGNGVLERYMHSNRTIHHTMTLTSERVRERERERERERDRDRELYTTLHMKTTPW
jgi:hypothetical protein